MAYNKKTGMYDGWIYLITNKTNGKKYVGQTSQFSIEVRIHQHLTNNPLYTHSIIDYSMQKNGLEYYKIEELEFISRKSLSELKEELNQREIYYILFLKTHISHGGYNITWGGNFVSNSCCTPVDMYTLDYNYLQSYNSISDAVFQNGFPHNGSKNIWSCCNGIKKSAYGYIWRYKGHDLHEFDLFCEKPSILIDIYDVYGSFLKTTDLYDFIKDNPEFKYQYIIEVCRGINKTCKGYVFRFHGEELNKYVFTNYQRNRAFNCYSIDDVYIDTFDNSEEAAIRQCPHIKRLSAIKNITTVAKGKKKTCGGYKWYYADDPNQPDKTKIISNAA